MAVELKNLTVIARLMTLMLLLRITMLKMKKMTEGKHDNDDAMLLTATTMMKTITETTTMSMRSVDGVVIAVDNDTEVRGWCCRCHLEIMIKITMVLLK